MTAPQLKGVLTDHRGGYIIAFAVDGVLREVEICLDIPESFPDIGDIPLAVTITEITKPCYVIGTLPALAVQLGDGFAKGPLGELDSLCNHPLIHRRAALELRTP